MSHRGIFGKLPGHGDFIQRELPASFVTPWDEWLQRAVHGSRELVGDRWLDYYLTSPIWLFAMSPGVLDRQGWIGILVPSVDSVGRYFPVTLAAPLENGSNPFAVLVEAEEWYEQASTLAIEALQHALSADQVLERFPPPPRIPGNAINVDREADLFTLSGASRISQHYPTMLEILMKEKHNSYSLWWCEGSQHLAPSSLLSPGLPDPLSYSRMLGAPKYHW
ncbi:type VI secretion system-associated protein TagF [Microbulbifer salipaludis]|uniref:Type VI secretion system-associated protein TagF n=1 Tax=Microbulbifer salipaludis TaxID=187980 RepID=A0ABS3E3K1_9GAMM|nr:type VI secretion system-associated protein TagF [Microbulbifer salipaludis]MBN8429891.1 type VI secretion system-associated protein TagF [Microbulbifer salipaludis]